MKVGVNGLVGLQPASLRSYYTALRPAFHGLGVSFAPYLPGQRLAQKVDLLWDPFCGWSQGPIWPEDAGPDVPRVVTFHGAAAFSMKPEEFWGGLTEALRNEAQVLERLQIWLKAADSMSGVICPSRFGRDEVIECTGITCPTWAIAHHGVDREVFRAEGPAIENVGILHVSAWQPKKNTARLVEAYLEMPAETRPPLTLVIPGKAPDFTERGRGIRVVNRFQSQESLARYYRGALLFAFPSLHETFGLPVAEAMACGCPVVAGRSGALPEVYGDAAVLVDPRNVGEITETLGALSADSTRRSRLRERGLALASTLSWRASAEAHFAAFSEVLSGAPVRPIGGGQQVGVWLTLELPGGESPGLGGTELRTTEPERIAGLDDPVSASGNELLGRALERFLAAIDSGRDDPRPLPEGWELRSEIAPFRRSVRSLIGQRAPDAPAVHFADPLLCRVLAPFLSLLSQEGYTKKVALRVADPWLAIGVLTAREDLDADRAGLLWLRYLLEAEQASRGVNREIQLAEFGGDQRLYRAAAARARQLIDRRLRRWIEDAYGIIKDWCETGEDPKDGLDAIATELGELDRLAAALCRFHEMPPPAAADETAQARLLADSLQAEILRLKGTVSWRVTGPLRAAWNIFRRLTGRSPRQP